MRALVRAAAAVFAVLSGGSGLTGCKDDAVAELEATRERVCQCKDAACVNTAMEAMQDLPTKHPRKAEAVAREITECVARIYRLSDAREAEPEPEDPGSGSGSDSGSGSGSDVTAP